MDNTEKIQKMYEKFVETGSNPNSIEFSKLMSGVIKMCQIFLRHTMGSKYSDDDIKDVLSDSLEKIFKGVANFRGDCSFLSWSISVCRYSFYNYYTRYAYKRSLSVYDVYNIEDSTYSDSQMIYDILPEHKDKIIFIKKLNGSTLKELSDDTGIHVNTIKTRLYRYKKEIKKMMIYEDRRISQNIGSV